MALVIINADACNLTKTFAAVSVFSSLLVISLKLHKEYGFANGILSHVPEAVQAFKLNLQVRIRNLGLRSYWKHVD